MFVCVWHTEKPQNPELEPAMGRPFACLLASMFLQHPYSLCPSDPHWGLYSLCLPSSHVFLAFFHSPIESSCSLSLPTPYSRAGEGDWHVLGHMTQPTVIQTWPIVTESPTQQTWVYAQEPRTLGIAIILDQIGHLSSLMSIRESTVICVRCVGMSQGHFLTAWPGSPSHTTAEAVCWWFPGTNSKGSTADAVCLPPSTQGGLGLQLRLLALLSLNPTDPKRNWPTSP